MKKNSILNLMTAGLSLCVVLGMSSCGEKELYNPEVIHEQNVMSYEQKFVDIYGPVSPTQSWDFTAAANTRAAENETAVVIDQWKDGNYGLEWKWKDSHNENKLNQVELNKIYNNDLEDIKAAVADTRAQKWDLSEYSSILFRVFATSPCDNTKTYMRVGVHLDSDKNWWIAQTNPKLRWHKGTNYMDHPRYLDLTQLPEDAFWFVIAQTHEEAKTNKQGAKVLASSYELKNYKVINVNGNTFWCFDCNDDGNYEDMIWWVEAVKKPVIPDEPTLVSEISKRYMMEDLGTIGDFDFNDAVVDLSQKTWSDGTVTKTGVVRALGGILDITIKLGGKTAWTKSSNLNPASIINTQPNYNENGNYGEFDASDWNPAANNIAFVVKGQNSEEVTINFPETGSVPQMVAVKITRNWMEENKRVPSIAWCRQ